MPTVLVATATATVTRAVASVDKDLVKDEDAVGPREVLVILQRLFTVARDTDDDNVRSDESSGYPVVAVGFARPGAHSFQARSSRIVVTLPTTSASACATEGGP